MTKTYHPKPTDIKKQWYVVDLKGKTLGRAATAIATVLSGKNKPVYSPAVDTGDYIIAINASGVKFTGKKLSDKIYYRHTGAIGGIKATTAEDMLKKDPTRVVITAVRGMLPKNKLGEHLIKKLKVYKNDQHEQAAQNPKPLEI